MLKRSLMLYARALVSSHKENCGNSLADWLLQRQVPRRVGIVYNMVAFPITLMHLRVRVDMKRNTPLIDCETLWSKVSLEASQGAHEVCVRKTLLITYVTSLWNLWMDAATFLLRLANWLTVLFACEQLWSVWRRTLPKCQSVHHSCLSTFPNSANFSRISSNFLEFSPYWTVFFTFWFSELLNFLHWSKHRNKRSSRVFSRLRKITFRALLKK